MICIPNSYNDVASLHSILLAETSQLEQRLEAIGFLVLKVAEALDHLSKASLTHGNLSLNSIVFERKDLSQIMLVDPCLAFEES